MFALSEMSHRGLSGTATGRSAPFSRSFVGQRYFDEYARTCSASQIGFNRSVRNDVNMRVFETLSCGTLLMTNDLRENGQEEIFQSDKHLVTYRSSEELLDKLRFYLRHSEARRRIAETGRAEAVERHTYAHRMRIVLESVAKSKSISVSVAGDGSAATDGHPVKDVHYYGSGRPEVAALVPESARRVLDIGCGAGRLGESLKQRQAVEVVGIELQSRAAALARTRLDQVLEIDVESADVGFTQGRFDCVIVPTYWSICAIRRLC